MGLGRLLLRHGADANGVNDYGSNALLTAVSSGYLSLVRELLQHEVKVSAANNVGFTALAGAVYKMNLQMVRELLQHEVTLHDANMALPLAAKLAADYAEFAIVKALLDYGAEFTVEYEQAVIKDHGLQRAKEIKAVIRQVRSS